MSTILLKNIYKEGELDKDSTCKEYLQVAHEGSNVLKFAAMRAKGVQAVVYSAHITPEFKVAVALHNKQYPGLEPKTMRTIHDRFLLIDDKVYHFGASFKDMGNEMTAFSVLDFVTPAEVIEKIQESMKGRQK